MKIYPNILKELRLSLHMPIETAAEKLQIDATTLLDWEEVGVDVDMKMARKIADIYHKPWTILLLQEIPHIKNLSKKFRSLYEDSLGKENKKMLLEALNNAERIIALAPNLEGRKPDWEILKKIALINDTSEIAAEKFRKWLGVDTSIQKRWKNSKNAYENWKNILESLGFYIVDFAFSKNNVEKKRAFCLTDGDYVVITLNKNDSESGKIFSLFHEVAHILRNDKKFFEVFDGSTLISDDNSDEIYANSFAGNFLLPKKDLLPYIGLINSENFSLYVQNLAKEYCISGEVVARRFYDTNLISQDQYKKKRKELVDKAIELRKIKRTKKIMLPKGYKLYQINIIKKNSHGFVNDVFEAYRTNLINYYEISKYLNSNSKHTPIIESLMFNYG